MLTVDHNISDALFLVFAEFTLYTRTTAQSFFPSFFFWPRTYVPHGVPASVTSRVTSHVRYLMQPPATINITDASTGILHTCDPTDDEY